MSIRTIQLPGDLMEIAKVISQGYQYPENPDWNIEADQGEQLINLVKTVQNLWPLVRLVQCISPIARDGLRGYLWEEEKKIVGLSTYRRLNQTTWRILDVVVLPAYRRRSIAQQLVDASLDDICVRDGKMVILEVIAGNLPAMALYQRLGFRHYDRRSLLSYTANESPQQISLPDGYTIVPSLDWRAHYDFECRITPQEIQRFAPVTKDDFHGVVKTIIGVIKKRSGVQTEQTAIMNSKGEIVAVGKYSATLNAGGVNSIIPRVDLAHPELAPFLIRHLLHTTLHISPEHRIEFLVPHWQEMVIDAALDVGCNKLYEEHRMGRAF